MILTGRDGVLTLYSGTGTAGTTSAVAWSTSAAKESKVVYFADMNASVPDGHPIPDITPVHNRGKYNASYSHYIAGATKISDPVDFTFSCKIDYTNNVDLEKILTGSSTDWPSSTGVTLPTVASADGGPLNTLNVVLDWSDGTNHYKKYLKDVLFPKSEVKITEAEDGVTLDVTGHVYGEIDTTTA